MDELDLALDVARAAGRVLLEHFERELEIETKSSAIDLVTPADRASEALVLARLRAATPDYGVLAEESGERLGPSQRRWIVDPLDGTTNFAHGFPFFSVSIALYEGERALVGVVHDPLRDESFVAAAGQGAHRVSASDRRRLRVSARGELGESLLATGFAYDVAKHGQDNLAQFARILPRVRGIRRAGSAALDLAYVAAARVDGYWEYHLNPWDWAAGALLVREAGGTIATIEGEPWSLRSSNVVAGNPTLCERLAQALRS
jgi:myo-inositol-1(or 4)-monophosphatase